MTIAANDARSGEMARILPRLIAIGARKYGERPAERRSAVRFILRNAIRLAELHLGRQEAAAVALATLEERDA